jgi:thioesterase domain-containing protein
VRGFRIELGEVETALDQYPGVRQNVVIAREDVPGDKRLVAYVAVGKGQSLAANALRKFLEQKLPDYMLPSRFIFLDDLPMTPNGKVDRKALPKPEQLELTEQEEYVAPRNSIESQLVKIWESVLNIRNVGVKENFFELGGHSLLVAKLISRIGRVFGKQLSMAAIFQAPSVEQQALLLRNGITLPDATAVVPIQPAGSNSPFFLLGFGAGPIFLPLARRLGSEQPVLCVGLNLSEASQLRTPYKMEDIAACLVRHLREVQPEGPYFLGGLCAGGLMAYETARQLLIQGQQVALLALFEPQTLSDTDGNSKIVRFGLLGQRLRFHLENLQQLEIGEAPQYMRARARTFLDRMKRLTWHTFYDLRSRMHDGRLRSLGDILYVAASAYRPQPYAGRVTLFQAIYRPRGRDWDPQGSWRALVAALEVHEIPGYHDSIFLEPNVEALANKLHSCLREAQSSRAGR